MKRILVGMLIVCALGWISPVLAGIPNNLSYLKDHTQTYVHDDTKSIEYLSQMSVDDWSVMLHHIGYSAAYIEVNWTPPIMDNVNIFMNELFRIYTLTMKEGNISKSVVDAINNDLIEKTMMAGVDKFIDQKYDTKNILQKLNTLTIHMNLQINPWMPLIEELDTTSPMDQ